MIYKLIKLITKLKQKVLGIHRDLNNNTFKALNRLEHHLLGI